MKGFNGKKSALLYFGLFTLFLVVFLYITFPVKPLKQRFISEIEKNSSYSANVKDASFFPLLSLSFTDVELSKAGETINIDSLTVSPSLLSLIFGDSLSIPFKARIKNGKISGTMNYIEDSQSLGSIKADLDNIDAKLISLIIKSDENSPNFDGLLSGSIDLAFSSKGSRAEPKGSYSFMSENFSISDIKIDKFPLPSYQGLKAKLEGKLSKRKTDIETFEIKNDDFELKIVGDMPLPWQLKKGRGKLNLSYKLLLFSDDAKLSFLKAFAKAQSDGSYIGMISGPVSNPKFKGTSKIKF